MMRLSENYGKFDLIEASLMRLIIQDNPHRNAP